MSARTYTDVLQIIKPDPDSHFLLLPCRSCSGDNVAFVKYLHQSGAELWRVVCFDCGAIVDQQASIRHDAQIGWNRRNKRG